MSARHRFTHNRVRRRRAVEEERRFTPPHHTSGARSAVADSSVAPTAEAEGRYNWKIERGQRGISL